MCFCNVESTLLRHMFIISINCVFVMCVCVWGGGGGGGWGGGGVVYCFHVVHPYVGSSVTFGFCGGEGWGYLISTAY